MSYSGVDQKRVSDFVNNNVFMNATDIVNDLIDCGKIELEDVIQYKAEYDGEEISEEQAQKMIDEFQDQIDIFENEYSNSNNESDFFEIQNLKNKIEELEDLDFDEPTEVLEYYFVTDYFGDQLEEKGEIIIDEYQAKIWGRTCSGQAIFLDGVVVEIAKENGII